MNMPCRHLLARPFVIYVCTQQRHFLGEPILAKGDQFWQPKSVQPDPFWQQKWSGGPVLESFSAKISLAGPILGGPILV